MCHRYRLQSWRIGCGRKRRYAFAEAGLPRYGCRRRTICSVRMWIGTWRRTTSTRRSRTSLEERPPSYAGPVAQGRFLRHGAVPPGRLSEDKNLDRQECLGPTGPHFLTLCFAVDYTIKFDTCRLSGLTAALCLRGEPAAS